MPQQEQTHYDILGVNENATEKEIRSAFRQMSLKHHPDRNLDRKEEATMIYQRISLANEILSDPQKRAEYDHELKYGSPPGMGMGGMGMDMNDIFGALFGGGMPGMRGMHGGMPPGMGGMPPGMGGFMHMNMGSMPGGMGSMGGMPGMPGMGGMGGMPGMGGMGGPGIQIFHMGPDGMFEQMNKPQAIMKSVEISLETAFHGGSYTLDIERTVIDNGNGRNNGQRRTENETMTIDIPKGIASNDCLVLQGKGHKMHEQAPPGDVKVIFTILNTTDFDRSGNDLVYHKTISLADALCGFSMEIKHLNGNLLNINNTGSAAVSIKPGYKRVINGMGMTKDGKTGNLIIEFTIEFPSKIAAENIETLRQLLS